MARFLYISSLFAVVTLATAHAQATDPAPVTLPDYTVAAAHVANPEPAGTLATPVSVLRYEPRVEVQARNLAEMQSDVTIRGGIFENTGFSLGALSLTDPQTGHYFAEIPVAPEMLTLPRILTGEGGAVQGFNANTGTVAYAWRPITERGVAQLAAGDHALEKASIYEGKVFGERWLGRQVASDVEWAHARSDGSVPYGDQNMDRLAARVQLRDESTQTDLYAGYQHKFFGWPDLYTPFGVNETENLQTVLLAANTRWHDAAGDWLEAGAYYRRNKDDYEFNRFIPGLFNPYQHTTWVRGAALTGHWTAGEWGADYSAHVLHDDLASTALVFGPYRSRDMLKLAFAPERVFVLPGGRLRTQAGLTYDDASHGGSSGSPLARLSWEPAGDWKYYAEYSGSSQLPTYTALKSSPTSGLFRGNQQLGRERSRNLEAGISGRLAGWQLEADVFRRQDRDLVDWTYRRGVTARSANPVDIDTTGLELLLSRRTERTEVVFGYSRLVKDATYLQPGVDASFYALNFPRQRLTLALVGKLPAGLEVRADNEYRIQEPNLLRATGGDHALRSSVSLHWLPSDMKGWEFSVQADNLWNSDFQDVPAVPAPRRQIATEVAYHW